MFDFIKKKTTFKKLNVISNKQKHIENSKSKAENDSGKSKQESNDQIPDKIEQVKAKLINEFSLCSDFNIRELVLGTLNVRMMIASLDGFFDKAILAENIIEPILNYSGEEKTASILTLLKERILCISDLREITRYSESVDAILNGDVILYTDNETTAFKIGLSSPEKRTVSEPDTEITLKGSREGFTENLRTNTILLRRRIKNANFKVENIILGKKSNTNIAICYIKNIAAPEIVEEVKKRVRRIDTDAILATGYIEQFIQDGRYPLFPVVGNSEKPDKVSAKLLEGRVAILADGTPTVLTVPFLMLESFQSQEDYFGEYYFSSMMRLLRVFCYFVSIYLPGLYVAVISFHQTIIPFKLMLTVAATREGIPFSAFIEALIMVVTFEILREAGLRMPRAIGQAVSIVGAIVLGDAAVSAGIASAPLVIIAALSGICSFIVPPLMKSGAVMRLIILIASSIMGLSGIGFVTFITTIYLCNKESFSVPYLAPFAPLQAEGLKDSLIIMPIWSLKTRPRALSQHRDLQRTTGKKLGSEGDS